MASQAELRSEPTPPATVSGVADTPRHIPSGNARDEASTVPFEGFNQRKSSMKASKASDDPAQAVPTVKAGSDSESRKASTLHPGFTVSGKPPRPNNNSDGRHGMGSVNQPSDSKSEEPTSAIESAPDKEDELKLIERIDSLWSSRTEKMSSAKLSRIVLNRLRDELAEQLYAYKRLLVGVGREGRWTPFLKERGIPKSTADNYVDRYKLTLARAEGKLPSKELLTPTAAEVTKKVKKLAPGLARFLMTPDSVAQFVRELGAALLSSTSTGKQHP